MAVPIARASPPAIGPPEPLFSIGTSVTAAEYAPSRDGQRILVLKRLQDAGSQPLTVVVNWPALLKK